MDLQSAKLLNRYFPNTLISSKIANFQHFTLRVLHNPKRGVNRKFPSQAEAISRIHKDFITLLKNHNKKKQILPTEKSPWKYAEIAFEAAMYKIAYNDLNKWNRREYTVIQEINLTTFRNRVRPDSLDKFVQSPSIVTSDLEVFVMKNQFIEKRKVSTWYLAYRTVVRQLEEMKKDTNKLEPTWYGSWRRINREYFNRPPASWKIAEEKLRKQFRNIENENFYEPNELENEF